MLFLEKKGGARLVAVWNKSLLLLLFRKEDLRCRCRKCISNTSLIFPFRLGFVIQAGLHIVRIRLVPETILLPVVLNAIETLRRRAAALTPIEKCKLHCLEANLLVARDQQMSAQAERLSAKYNAAAQLMRANALSAGSMAEALWFSNRRVADVTRVAMARSRFLIDRSRV
jgi:hypothetical protein